LSAVQAFAVRVRDGLSPCSTVPTHKTHKQLSFVLEAQLHFST